MRCRLINPDAKTVAFIANPNKQFLSQDRVTLVYDPSLRVLGDGDEKIAEIITLKRVADCFWSMTHLTTAQAAVACDALEDKGGRAA